MTDSTISSKLNALRESKFRSKFKLTQKDREYIAAKGLETIKEHTFQFINSRVAPEYPKNDGKQTPIDERVSGFHHPARNRHLLPEVFVEMAQNR